MARSVRTRATTPSSSAPLLGTYLSSALVRDRGPDLAIFCKAWRVRNTGGRFAKDQFSLDFDTGQLTCPAGAAMPFEPGKTVRFPKDTCAACPLRQRCTASSNGRSVSIHPDEALLAGLRQRQQTPGGREELRERVQVGHALAHVGHWQGRRARYLGTRKNLFDLRRVAVVHNLHIIARKTSPTVTSQPPDGYLTGALVRARLAGSPHLREGADDPGTAAGRFLVLAEPGELIVARAGGHRWLPRSQMSLTAR